MRHPYVRCVLAVLAVVAVISVMKSVGLSPNDVFAPRHNWHIDTPFGDIHVGDDRAGWFNPLLLAHVLSVPALWHLCRRAGYSSWFSLAMLIPLANVLLLYFLAFAEWPNQPRDERLGGGTQPAEEKPMPKRPSDDIRV